MTAKKITYHLINPIKKSYAISIDGKYVGKLSDNFGWDLEFQVSAPTKPRSREWQRFGCDFGSRFETKQAAHAWLVQNIDEISAQHTLIPFIA